MHSETDSPAELKAFRVIFMGWLWFPGWWKDTMYTWADAKEHMASLSKWGSVSSCYSSEARMWTCELRRRSLGAATRKEDRNTQDNIIEGNCSAAVLRTTNEGTVWARQDVPGPLLCIPNTNGTWVFSPRIHFSRELHTAQPSLLHPVHTAVLSRMLMETKLAIVIWPRYQNSYVTHFPRGTGTNRKEKYLISWEQEHLG